MEIPPFFNKVNFQQTKKTFPQKIVSLCFIFVFFLFCLIHKKGITCAHTEEKRGEREREIITPYYFFRLFLTGFDGGGNGAKH